MKRCWVKPLAALSDTMDRLAKKGNHRSGTLDRYPYGWGEGETDLVG